MTIRLADAQSLLASLTRVFPPPIGVKHAITLGDDEGSVLVTVFHGGRWTSVTWDCERDDGTDLSAALREMAGAVKAGSKA